jgi:hypothetical protein
MLAHLHDGVLEASAPTPRLPYTFYGLPVGCAPGYIVSPSAIV